MTFLLDASVSPYKRPLKIWDFVWEIKYWDRRTLNNFKSNFSFNGINKKDLPAIYSTVFRCLLVVLLVSLALLHNHCYSFIRQGQGWSLRSGNVLDQSQQKCRFFAEIQVCCKFFQLQPKRVGFLLERKRKFSSWVAVEKICSRHWTKARRTSKSGTNGSIWWGNYKAFSSRSLREEKEVSLLGWGWNNLQRSRLEFRRKDGIFVATGPGSCQIEWHSKHA